MGQGFSGLSWQRACLVCMIMSYLQHCLKATVVEHTGNPVTQESKVILGYISSSKKQGLHETVSQNQKRSEGRTE